MCGLPVTVGAFVILQIVPATPSLQKVGPINPRVERTCFPLTVCVVHCHVGRSTGPHTSVSFPLINDCAPQGTYRITTQASLPIFQAHPPIEFQNRRCDSLRKQKIKASKVTTLPQGHRFL